MRIKTLILIINLLFVSALLHAQLDKPIEGFSIKPSDSTFKADFKLSIKPIAIKGLTNKNIQYKIKYTPIPDSFKKTSGVNIAETSTLKKPTWDVKQKFTEDYQNVSRFSKDYLLGEVTTSSKSVIVQCRDHEYVDGDRIKLMVNGVTIHPNLTLSGDFFTIDIDLKEGVNAIEFIALNEGTSRPNTAQLRVYDENGKQLASNRWLITTGYKASLTVYRE